MVFDIEKGICNTYPSLNPLDLLNYPAEDVFELINGMLDYNQRKNDDTPKKDDNKVIRRPADDSWF